MSINSKTNRLFYFIIAFCISQNTTGQFGFTRYDSIPVLLAGDTMNNPWAGAFNAPHFSDIDLNGDGLKDLLVAEKDGYSGGFMIMKTFINKGTPGKVDYWHAPEYQNLWPDDIKNFCLLADYNCDGYEDLFTYTLAGIRVYRNNYTPGGLVDFELAHSRIESDYGGGSMVNIYLDPRNIPALIDVNNDGDLDVLGFGIASQFVEYHENQSMELYGHCDSLVFELQTPCWGNFAEGVVTLTPILNQSCKGGFGGSGNPTHNGGTTMLALDWDNDLDKDLMLGMLSFKNMVGINNGGDTATANMDSIDLSCPAYNSPIYLTFPSGFHLDVNNDSIRDLIASTNANNNSENYKNTWYYRNDSIDAYPRFKLQQSDFLTDGMIETGEGCNPAFFDYNGDGQLDLILGNYGYSVNGGLLSKLTLFENIGSSSSPVFSFVTADYDSISQLNLLGLHPTFGDLDNDGDQDMICGDSNGKLYLLENQAGAGNVANFSMPTNSYMNIDVGNFAAPQLVDIDKDGDLDLIVGEEKSNLNYFENTGSNTNAVFSANPTSNMFGNVNAGAPCCTGYSNVYFVEMAPDDYTLFVGHENGYIYKYTNISGNLSGTFKKSDSLYTHGLRVSVSGADLNSDGVVELIYGQYSGGPTLLKKHGITGDINGNGVIDNGEIAGDINGNGIIDNGEIAGDINGNGIIDNGEIAGDINGNGVIDGIEVVGDINGNGIIDGIEILGDANGNGILDPSETVQTPENKADRSFIITPNPTCDVSIVKTKESGRFLIFNALGQIVLEKDLNEYRTSINLSRLPGGIYFTQLNGEFKTKLVKQ